MIVFLKRRALGRGLKGVVASLNSCEASAIGLRTHLGSTASLVRNDKLALDSGILQGTYTQDLLIRWGCTAQTGYTTERQLNKSSGIQTVNNKMGFRELLTQLSPDIVPKTLTSITLQDASHVPPGPLVLRPKHHAQGKNLFVTNGLTETLNVVRERPDLFAGGWYASELIDKVSEYRVYVVSGRVATVARKTPGDPSAVAWNVAQGGRFDVVPWGEWPMEGVRVALEAFQHSGLDFSGVDVMLDASGRAYVIELNSAPSLPLLSDGSISYRQKVMAKCFKYIHDNTLDHFEMPTDFRRYTTVIHPAVT